LENLLASDELVYVTQFPMDLLSLPCMTHFPLYDAGSNFFFFYLHSASDFVLIIEDTLRIIATLWHSPLCNSIHRSISCTPSISCSVPQLVIVCSCF
jgi:hypothetical protein